MRLIVNSPAINACIENHGPVRHLDVANVYETVFITHILNVIDFIENGSLFNLIIYHISRILPILYLSPIFIAFIAREKHAEMLFAPKVTFTWEIVSTKLRNRRDVIFSFADFVGAFGGAATLLLGVNFLHIAIIALKIVKKFFKYE